MKRLLVSLLLLAQCVAACSSGTAQAPTVVAPAPAASGAAAEGGSVGGATAEPVAQSATWIVTTEGAPFVRSTLEGTPGGAPPVAPASGTPGASAARAAELVVDASRPLQAIEGFGGAFNEHGWDVLGVLPEAERQAVIRQLFDPVEGLRFDYCRTPIGASDYALERYTLNETPGDYAMEKFSIARDERYLIPFIRAALAIRPDLRLWASAWTPPTWLKTNGAFDSGAMRDEPRAYAAYALYLAKYIEAYRQAGIRISMVVPQNEPAQLTHYPSCDWTPAQYVTFIRDHLAPTFATRKLDAQIYVGTINRETWDVLSVLRDAGTAAVISGAAFQWGGLAHVEPVRQAFPNLTLMQSETECGNHARSPSFNPETPPNDFRYAAYTFRKFRDFIGRGVSSYMLWNMVLDEHGKNIDTRRPWPQNSAIVVDRKTQRVTYTPMFWVTKHFSALVERGGRVVPTNGGYADAVAFQNPDGTLVVELLNDAASTRSLSVVAAEQRYLVELPAQSVATLLVPAR